MIQDDHREGHAQQRQPELGRKTYQHIITVGSSVIFFS
jgi:hypothetical protein